MSSVIMTSPSYVFMDKTKGSFRNRAECAKEQFKNNAKTTAGMLASAGAVQLTSNCIIKSSNPNIVGDVMNTILEDIYRDAFKESKGMEKLASGIKYAAVKAEKAFTNFLAKEKPQQVINYLDSVVNKATNGGLEKLSGKFGYKGAKTAFALVVVGMTVTAITALLTNYYRKGQIDQKYTDKAQQEQNQINFPKPRFPKSYGLGL